MKIFRLCIIAITCMITDFEVRSNVSNVFNFFISEISTKIFNRINTRSWKEPCPVSIQDLRYVVVSHWGYDDQIHTGEVIVHKSVAEEIVDIFKELFEARFPIESLRLIDDFNADDFVSMAHNNSSAFCCRAITNFPGKFSKHSYGIAIDINTKVNPYVKGSCILPKEGALYCDRTKQYKGMITDTNENVCYQAFAKRGWSWGGHWESLKDYQHFEKDIPQ